MNKVRSAMFSLIHSCLTGKNLSKAENAVDSDILPELFEISKAQDLAHLVAMGLYQNGLLKKNDEIGKKFFEQQMIAVVRFERINYEFDRICALFNEAEIPFMPLKGSVLREYYPEPWMRTSCDIDILIHPEDVDKSIELLTGKLKYSEGRKNSHDISIFSEGGVHLELHYGLIEDSEGAGKILSKVWNSSAPAENGKYQYEMSPSMFYLYHIAHMAKHFDNGGCGVRPFIDIWIMDHNGKFSKEICDVLLETSDLRIFADAARHLARVWLDNEKPDELSNQLEEYIISSGIYGNVKNKVAVQQVKKGGKIKYALSRIFLPYNELIYHYPALEGKKLLLPVYQVKRWIKLIFIEGRRKRSLRELNINNSITGDDSLKTKNLLSQLGLLE